MLLLFNQCFVAPSWNGSFVLGPCFVECFFAYFLDK